MADCLVDQFDGVQWSLKKFSGIPIFQLFYYICTSRPDVAQKRNHVNQSGDKSAYF
jgi:hypothetical protein